MARALLAGVRVPPWSGTGAAFPERREELELYLESFRGVAGVDGRLPGDVDLVVEDVFADLIAHSRG